MLSPSKESIFISLSILNFSSSALFLELSFTTAAHSFCHTDGSLTIAFMGEFMGDIASSLCLEGT
jgi:hypothetical protein